MKGIMLTTSQERRRESLKVDLILRTLSQADREKRQKNALRLKLLKNLPQCNGVGKFPSCPIE